MDFLWHNISEKEKEEIKKQVDSVLNSFSKKLATLKEKTEVDNSIEREECTREEGGDISDLSRKIMFENAPDKNEDSIIAERKKW
jgi:Asp-tRNA(Asn)/Glu-tRNA(Gln) amidotransferase C subunit